MPKNLVALIHYSLAFACLGIMLNSAGWLLMFSAILWIPALAAHLIAINRGMRAFPRFANRLLISSAGFLVFVLARYDGGDTGGYTGLSCLLARAGVLDTAFIDGWEGLQLLYLWLPVQLVFDIRIAGLAEKYEADG